MTGGSFAIPRAHLGSEPMDGGTQDAKNPWSQSGYVVLKVPGNHELQLALDHSEWHSGGEAYVQQTSMG